MPAIRPGLSTDDTPSKTLPKLPSGGGSSGWLDVNQIVRDALPDIRKRVSVALTGRPFQIRLKTRLKATTPVRANPTEIRDIITQLVVCAVRAMNGPATVTVTTASVAKGTLLAVTDDRTTISAGFKARLFDPSFVSTNERLLVLRACGMAMSRHGGKVGVLSEPNIGTTVTMRFPRPKALE
jgi:signal transduction histidine kinase